MTASRNASLAADTPKPSQTKDATPEAEVVLSEDEMEKEEDDDMEDETEEERGTFISMSIKTNYHCYYHHHSWCYHTVFLSDTR